MPSTGTLWIIPAHLGSLTSATGCLVDNLEEYRLIAGGTLAQLDPNYFLDYAVFTGAVRHYASQILEVAFKGDPNPARRRLHLINLIKEEYAAYEDAGAVLNAFLDWREGKVDVPFASLLAYKPGEVALATMFESHKIASSDQLYAALGLDTWIPGRWEEWYPELDLKKALRLACAFFFQDCATNQKRYGVISYNKIKHGLLVVPSGRAYKNDMPDSPATLFSTPAELQKEGAPPYTIQGFPSDDTQIQQRHASIEFVQCDLRLFAGLYVVSRYPEALAAKGINPQKLFDSKEFHDVRHLISEVTKKK